ncbi:MAG: restriction endonuclease [Chloroflexota bacterium]|nr:restriction endonuclease [Chloroflexota bacterium]
MNHSFTDTILALLADRFGELSTMVFEHSPLLQYLNIKTRSASSGSKARGAFANHYALCVLIEDYIKKGFVSNKKGQYLDYEGARFGDLLRRQRELPFGAKLQNHALNSRLNDEFAKYFPTLERRPVLRDQQEQRYWVNESLLLIPVLRSGHQMTVNIAEAIIEIIDAYVSVKRSAFQAFIDLSKQIAALSNADAAEGMAFIRQQLQPHIDARIFEIISFALLKAHYGEQSIFWGWTLDNLNQQHLMLYKTGRTNANDGGIDFVMKPLGRFFQVTETADVNKYFLDLDKINKFPLTFVIKTVQDTGTVLIQIRRYAEAKYGVTAIVERYMNAIEEIITIPTLISIFETLASSGQVQAVMREIVMQSQVEFNDEHVDAPD